MPSDIALRYDPVTRLCDVVFEGRDFALDSTPATPMLMALGTMRRARPDDDLPLAVGDFAAPASFLARGGWAGDAFDPRGRLSGSRIWLYLNAKQTEQTRLGVEAAAAEALASVETDRGLSITLTVRWLRRGVMSLIAAAADTRVSLLVGAGA